MRILLIDDHALFRFGLQELLERRGVGEIYAVGDRHEGRRMAEEKVPDVVLLDMRMPGASGLDVLRELRTAFPDMPIAMLTTSGEEHDVVASLQQGASGYLLKDMEPDELVDALSDIVAGKTVVAKELATVLAKAVQAEAHAPAAEPRFSDLTPRELEILCHLAEGQSNKAIAGELGITDGTVKLHVKAILRKLSVHSRVEAAVIAVERNLCARRRDVAS